MNWYKWAVNALRLEDQTITAARFLNYILVEVIYRKLFKYLLVVTWWRGLCEMVACKDKALNLMIQKVSSSTENHFYFSLEVACTKESLCKWVKIFRNTVFQVSHISQMKAYFCSVLHYCLHQHTHKCWWTSGWVISLSHSTDQGS